MRVVTKEATTNTDIQKVMDVSFIMPLGQMQELTLSWPGPNDKREKVPHSSYKLAAHRVKVLMNVARVVNYFCRFSSMFATEVSITSIQLPPFTTHYVFRLSLNNSQHLSQVKKSLIKSDKRNSSH